MNKQAILMYCLMKSVDKTVIAQHIDKGGIQRR